MNWRIAVLHQLYGDLVGRPWELSGTTAFPEKAHYFSPTFVDGLWVSIDFGFDGNDGKVHPVANLRLYDPALGDPEEHFYLDVWAYDDAYLCDACIMHFGPRSSGLHDGTKCEWASLATERLKEICLERSRMQIRALMARRVFDLHAAGRFDALGISDVAVAR